MKGCAIAGLVSGIVGVILGTVAIVLSSVGMGKLREKEF